MRALHLPSPALAELFSHLSACFPDEGCGVILGSVSDAEVARFVPMPNLQGRLHTMDPMAYPRDARTAYAMDPLKLQRLIDAAEAQGEALLAIVHSHPGHPAYLSATDIAAATPFGLPTFPDAAQVVVAVFEREIAEVKAFWHDGEAWVERPVSGLPTLPGPPAGAKRLGEG
jgi:proteasome lid subunit RPN8/RPN11